MGGVYLGPRGRLPPYFKIIPGPLITYKTEIFLSPNYIAEVPIKLFPNPIFYKRYGKPVLNEILSVCPMCQKLFLFPKLKDGSVFSRGGELGVLRVREHPLNMEVHPLTAKSTPSK